MVFSTITAAASGAMGLFSGVKGLFDSAKAARKRKALMREGKAAEAAWYRRNYYGDFMNDTATRAAMKRVENTLHRNNRQNRAYARINGATPELALARGQQSMQSVENVMGALASQQSAERKRVDAQHLQNMNAFRNAEIADLSQEEQSGANAAAGGFNLLNSALMAVNWGNESKKKYGENNTDNNEQ